MKTGYKKLLSAAFYLALTTTLLGGGCTDDETEVPIGSFGKSVSVVLDAQEGTRTIQVKSNGTWHATLSSATKLWASIQGNATGDGNGSFTVDYQANDELLRRGVVLISSTTQRTIDTIYLKQYGIQPFCKLAKESINFTSIGAVEPTHLDTNLPISKFEQVQVEVSYDDPKNIDWITTKINSKLDSLYVETTDNPEFAARSAKLRLFYVDDWGTTHESLLAVEQGLPGGTPATVVKSFADIRALISGADGELVIEDDIALEGRIISDCLSANMGDCPNTAPHEVDYQINDRTAYIQSIDGSLGFALQTTKPEFNQMHRYDQTKIWLKGLKLVKQSNPERYSILDLNDQCVITRHAGKAADLTPKNRYMADLTDQDIYTYVTLKHCEMPARRGSLLPINGGYIKRFSKYPHILADNRGDWMYIITNLNCPYAHEKEGLPKGEGKVSGIVVHESFLRFEPDGNIGKYQIRHVSASDIAISKSVADNFSETIVEWAECIYHDNLPDKKDYRGGKPMDLLGYEITSPNNPWCMIPTAGKGAMYFSTGEWISPGHNFTDPTTTSIVVASAWARDNLWDMKADQGRFWIMQFSTQGISTNLLTLAFTLRNNHYKGVPYWAAEYSTDQGTSWKTIREFIVPNQANWDNTLLNQMPGDKSFYMVLPQELLGVEKAMVRLHLISDKMGTADSFDGGSLKNQKGVLTGNFTISYAAIRYKK